ncbi:hypothetical protein PMIN01_03667 [Paraphaeosphaeria minitans]|uniref:Uncharacterized protein n=1 Tax=Paraphaeosphaeria minitans TaxID=565426 RepID=A0A9P6KU29_9PLEO|nr:hypothetical protein PMIN01_03667 [Paraphaeosphaeria minitans]
MVANVSRVHRRAVEAARTRCCAKVEGGLRLTYFAVTGGLKDAWCIRSADRGVGDVHGRRRAEGDGEFVVGEQRRRVGSGGQLTVPAELPPQQVTTSPGGGHRLLGGRRAASSAPLRGVCPVHAVSARPQESAVRRPPPPTAPRVRCVLNAPPTTTLFDFYPSRPRRVSLVWPNKNQPLPSTWAPGTKSRQSRPLECSWAPSLSPVSVSADARCEDPRPALLMLK